MTSSKLQELNIQFFIEGNMDQHLEVVMIYAFTTNQISIILLLISIIHTRTQNIRISLKIPGRNSLEMRNLLNLKLSNGKYGVYNLFDNQ